MPDSNIQNESQVRATLYYDSADQFLYDIGVNIERAMSPLFSVKSEKITGGASPALPFLEIVLISASTFAATQFMGSILSEAGKDLYKLLKSKFRFTKAKNDQNVMISIAIVNDHVAVRGNVTFDNHKTIAEAFETAHQMIADVCEKWDIDLEQLPLGTMYVNRTPIRSTLHFAYDYDKTAKKWKLAYIGKQEDD